MTHNWEVMIEAIQSHIGSLNWGYRVALRDKNVKYINALATLVDAHTINVSYFVFWRFQGERVCVCGRFKG